MRGVWIGTTIAAVVAATVLTGPAAATPRRSAPAMPPQALRPPGGQKICTLGEDRRCGPARAFGPWRVKESSSSPGCSAHFCVHWVPRTRDAPHLGDRDDDGVPNYVELVLSVSEHSYDVMVGDLGWRPPLADEGKGGDDRTDIYLFNTDLNTRANALAVYDGPQGTSSRRRSGWMILDDDYDDPTFHGDAVERVLEYFVPHELHHIFQVGYDTALDSWMFEATAEWMASRVYSHPRFFAFTGALGGTTTQPLYRFGYRAYSFATWNAWLADRIGPDVVRRTWELAPQYPRSGHHSTEILDRAIEEASRGTRSFGSEFLRFATATAEWSPRDFEGGDFFDDVERVGSLRAGAGVKKLHLAQSSWAVLDVKDPEASAYTLAVDIGHEAPAGIALIGRGGDRVVREVLDLPEGGAGSVTLAAPRGGFDRLSAVLVNTEIRTEGYGGEGKPGFAASIASNG